MTESRQNAYFDYAASNPLWPEAAAALAEALEVIGNPSATHAHGRVTREMLDRARQQAADFLAVSPNEITFVSGATEANNLIVSGLVAGLASEHSDRTVRVAGSALEHASVSAPLKALVDSGTIGLDEMGLAGSDGTIDPAEVRKAIRPDTVAVFLTAANNVLGTIQPLAEVAAVVREERARRLESGDELPLMLFSDAVQAAAWIELRPAEWGLDGLVISGHKCGGPKGTGALWLRPGLEIKPQLLGGGQEFGRRSGTENLAAIVGLGAALETAADLRSETAERCRRWRERLTAELTSAFPKLRLLGSPEPERQLPGTLYLHYPGTEGDILAMKMDAAGLSVSAGSACDAGQRRSPSVVESVYGPQIGRWGGLRVSFGRMTSEQEVLTLIGQFKETLGS